MFLNGVQAGSTYSDSNNYAQTALVFGCRTDGSFDFGGYIDEIRVTKGVARYTADFTAPSSPFPNP
jgi:hypothetical protein